MNDGGRWKFINDGKPLPFEDESRYTLASIRERAGPDLIDDFKSWFGICDPSEENHVESVLVDFQRDPLRELTFETAQRDLEISLEPVVASKFSTRGLKKSVR